MKKIENYFEPKNFPEDKIKINNINAKIFNPSFNEITPSKVKGEGGVLKGHAEESLGAEFGSTEKVLFKSVKVI